jgi:uncharacterized SAM-binding protein YcdF (DUF218 family)
LNVRYLLWYLLSPSQLLVLGLVAGAALSAFGRMRPGRILAGMAGVGLLLFGLLPGAAYLAYPLETRFPQPALPPGIAGIILLTGAEQTATSEASGLPQLGAHGNRYVAALRLAARYPDARLVVSGEPMVQAGKPPLGTQTAVARAILSDVGVDPGRVAFEQRSRDTCDNARNTRSLVDPRQGDAWVVVTSAIHMPRTIACFRAAGWSDVIAQPDDYHAALGFHGAGALRIVSNLQLLDSAVHEWVGLAYYRLAGRTDEFFPAP